MKKITSILLKAALLAAMLTAFALPASAYKPMPQISGTEITAENEEIHAEGSCVITKTGTVKVKVLEVKENSTLGIGVGVVVVVSEKFINNGNVIANGTINVTGCKEKTGLENVTLGSGNIIVGEIVPETNTNKNEGRWILIRYPSPDGRCMYGYIIGEDGLKQVATYLYYTDQTVVYTGCQEYSIGDCEIIDPADVPQVVRNMAAQDYPDITPAGSTFSEGYIWIIAVVAVVAIGGVAALVIVKKKKKPAQADDE